MLTQGSGMKVSISPPDELFRLAQVLAEGERDLAYVIEEDCMSNLQSQDQEQQQDCHLSFWPFSYKVSQGEKN